MKEQIGKIKEISEKMQEILIPRSKLVTQKTENEMVKKVRSSLLLCVAASLSLLLTVLSLLSLSRARSSGAGSVE
jgi:hypothetical protein